MTPGAEAPTLEPPAAPDLRLVLPAGATWATSAWAVGAAPAATAAAGAGAVLLGVVVLLARRRLRAAGVVVLALACVGAVLFSASAHLRVRGSGLVAALVGESATVQAQVRVLGDPAAVRPDPDEEPWQRSAEPRLVVRVLAEQVTGRGMSGPARAPLLVLAGPSWAEVRPGERYEVGGRLAATSPGDDVVALLVARGPPRLVVGPTRWQDVAESLRRGLRDAAEPLPPDAGGLLPGLVVGDTSRLPPDLEEAMRRVGLTHLTAVSGANVTIVCGSVVVLAATAGAGRRVRLLLAAAALVGFVVLARPEPSVLRAGVMGAIGLLGLGTGRRGRGIPVLSTAVVALCVVDPWLARSFGFALSVLATGALLVLARPWAAWLGRWMPRVLAQAVAVPAAAQAVCAPVVVLLAPEVALLAVPANLLVAPAVAPATVLGVTVTAVAPVWEGGAEVVARVAGVATAWIALVARTGADVPGGVLPWPGGAPGALLLAAGTLLAVAVLRVLFLRADKRGTRAARSAVPRRPRLLGAVVVLVAAGAVGGASGAAVVTLRPASWPPPGWVAVACDVGQGDALVVASGPASAVVIDTGPDPGPVDRCLDRLGVTRVDLLVLSHFHADHVDGLGGVLDGREVTRAVVSPLAAPEDRAERALRMLGAAGVPVDEGWAGLGGTAGAVAWRSLWPERLIGGGAEADAANDASVVLLLERPDLRILATGDVEPPSQAALRGAIAAGDLGAVAPVDVLKVAHHGSAAQDVALHRLLAPRVALVSAGRDNDYGHPTAVALDLVEEVGATVLRTDRQGDLAVGGEGDGLWTATTTGSTGPSASRGSLPPWLDATRQPGRPGATWGRRPSSSSAAPRGSSATGRWTGSGVRPGMPTPTWSSSRSRRRRTRPGSSRRGRAPPSSGSRGSWW